MAEGLNSIIAQLEQQLSAIDKALVALRSVDGIEGAPAGETPSTTSPGTRKGRMSPDGKKRLVAALKKRWAAKKAAASTLVVSPKATSSKSGMTEDGRRRLADAMKRRWAVKRAASQVKKRGSKKAA